VNLAHAANPAHATKPKDPRSKKRLLSPLGILLLAFLPSCINTGDDVDDDDAVDELFPSESVSVSLVDLGTVCGATEATVTVSNSGTGVLTISEVTVDGEWTVVNSPTEVAAGAAADPHGRRGQPDPERDPARHREPGTRRADRR
jgi:hypothetical protein